MTMPEPNAVVQYLFRMPKEIPNGLVLVHNNVRPTRHLGMRGFRAWLEQPDPQRLEECSCGWAPEFTRHYRVTRAGR